MATVAAVAGAEKDVLNTGSRTAKSTNERKSTRDKHSTKGESMSKSLCADHEKRLKKLESNVKLCRVLNCKHDEYARGLCKIHYVGENYD